MMQLRDVNSTIFQPTGSILTERSMNMKITNLVAQFSFFYQVYYIFVYLTIDPREGN